MLTYNHKIRQLSAQIRRIADGQEIDLRDNREGALSALKNDVHILAQMRQGQVEILQEDQKVLKDTLADISHQIKTPLTSALVMMDLIDSAPPEKREEFIRNIKMSLQRTEWLVSALLSRAKFESGIIDFAKEEISSTDLIEKAIEPLSVQIELKDLNIVIKGETLLSCDIRWTTEALINIVKNAVEHSPEGAVIYFESKSNPLYTSISVIDQGPGIPKAKLARVFHRFKGSESQAGHGIGLPLALAIMRRQSGDIEIENSDDGYGAVATLRFYPRTD